MFTFILDPIQCSQFDTYEIKIAKFTKRNLFMRFHFNTANDWIEIWPQSVLVSFPHPIAFYDNCRSTFATYVRNSRITVISYTNLRVIDETGI